MSTDTQTTTRRKCTTGRCKYRTTYTTNTDGVCDRHTQTTTSKQPPTDPMTRRETLYAWLLALLIAIGPFIDGSL